MNLFRDAPAYEKRIAALRRVGAEMSGTAYYE